MASGTVAGEMISIVVTVEIQPARIVEFLEVRECDALESRKEPGCLRFDLLQSSEKENTYHFYEIYKNADALAAHRETPHFKLWADFKASGGVVSQTNFKAKGVLVQ
eukprot:g9856.t1